MKLQLFRLSARQPCAACGASALLLAAAAGRRLSGPASEAFVLLSSVGTPTGLYPLPVGVHEVAVNFQPLPADNSVKWQFTHQGDDLASIVARVEPNGDKWSTVSLDYVEGSRRTGIGTTVRSANSCGMSQETGA